MVRLYYCFYFPTASSKRTSGMQPSYSGFLYIYIYIGCIVVVHATFSLGSGGSGSHLGFQPVLGAELEVKHGCGSKQSEKAGLARVLVLVSDIVGTMFCARAKCLWSRRFHPLLSSYADSEPTRSKVRFLGDEPTYQPNVYETNSRSSSPRNQQPA